MNWEAFTAAGFLEMCLWMAVWVLFACMAGAIELWAKRYDRRQRERLGK